MNLHELHMVTAEAFAGQQFIQDRHGQEHEAVKPVLPELSPDMAYIAFVYQVV